MSPWILSHLLWHIIIEFPHFSLQYLALAEQKNSMAPLSPALVLPFCLLKFRKLTAASACRRQSFTKPIPAAKMQNTATQTITITTPTSAFQHIPAAPIFSWGHCWGSYCFSWGVQAKHLGYAWIPTCFRDCKKEKEIAVTNQSHPLWK